MILPPAAKEMLLAVAAPGFAFRMLRLAVPEDRQLALGVDQTAGTLVIENDDPLDALDPNAPMIYVLKSGASKALPLLVAWARAAGSPSLDPKQKVIPAVEPGDYQACLGPVIRIGRPRLRDHTPGTLRQGSFLPQNSASSALKLPPLRRASNHP